MLLEIDKSGKFAVLPMNEFQKKSDLAVMGMFKRFDGNLKKIKREIFGVLKDCEFPSQVSKLNSTSSDKFLIKFFLKDHKVDIVLRVVLNK